MLSSHCFKPSPRGMKPLHSPPAWGKDHRAVWRQAGRGTSSASVNTGVELFAWRRWQTATLDPSWKASLKGQWSTESLQSRAAAFGQAGKGEAEQSFVIVLWGQEQDQRCERDPQPCLCLWESMVWEHSSAWGRARQRYWQDFSMDPQNSTST